MTRRRAVRRLLGAAVSMAALACGGEGPVRPALDPPPDTAPGSPVPADTRAPILEHMSFSPDRLMVLDRPKRVTVTVRAADEGAGVSSVVVHFRAPSSASITGLAALSLTGGTPGRGRFEGPFDVPAFAEAGTWVLGLVRLEDGAGNVALWDEGTLRARGFAVELEVVRGR